MCWELIAVILNRLWTAFLPVAEQRLVAASTMTNDEGLPCVRCAKRATLHCPKCLQDGLPQAASAFCSQECFKASWADHKKVHKKAFNGWLYVTKRGQGRAKEMPSFAYTGTIRPDVVSPMQQVPASITHPDYAQTGVPIIEQRSKQQQAIISRTPKEIEGMRVVCRMAREILDAAHAAVRPGVTTDDIDRVVHQETLARGAYPSPLNYYNFPKSVCTSVNEVICHGIPDKRPLRDGDIVNVDVTAYYGGFHGDLNETFVVGDVDEAGKTLIKVTHECLWKAIALVKPGTRFRDVGDVISKHAKLSGLSVVKTYCGHGISDLFHCAPSIPHYSPNKAVGIMKEGQTFTIEPMINTGSWRDVTWPDGWTSATADGSRSAQFEHTLLVTATGCEVLTQRLDTSPKLWWEHTDASSNE